MTDFKRKALIYTDEDKSMKLKDFLDKHKISFALNEDDMAEVVLSAIEKEKIIDTLCKEGIDCAIYTEASKYISGMTVVVRNGVASNEVPSIPFAGAGAGDDMLDDGVGVMTTEEINDILNICDKDGNINKEEFFERIVNLTKNRDIFKKAC